MSRNHLTPVSSTQTRIFDPTKKGLDSLKHVRSFGYSPGVCTLQIRSKGRVRDDKVWHAYSVAYLNEEQALAVIAGLQEWVDEQLEWRKLAVEAERAERLARLPKDGVR